MKKLALLAIILATITAIAGASADGPVITGIEVREGPETVTLTVKADRKTAFHAVKAPNLIQVDIPKGQLQDSGRTVPVYVQKVKLYSTEILDGGELLRLKIVLFEPVPYELMQEENSLTVVVNNSSGDPRAFEERLRTERLEAQKVEENRAKAVELYRQASDLLKEKRYQEAMPLFEKALSYAPGDPDISAALEVAREAQLVIEQFKREFQLAEDAFSSGNFQRAVKDFTDFLDRYPDNDDALYYLGRAYFEINDFNLAASTFRRLMKINPHYANIESAHEYLRRSEQKRADKVQSLIDVSATNESMVSVLRSMLFGTGLKLDVKGEISRLISVDLKQVTLEEALDQIVNTNGARWDRKADVIEVAQTSDVSEFVKKMHFQDMPLGEILDIISSMMKINLIINDEVNVKRRVTFFVKNHEITLNELFDLLLITNNLVKREYNRNTYFIVEKDKAKMYDYEKRYQKIYNLNNVEPEEVLAVLNSVEAYKEKINFSNLVVINLDEESNIVSTESRRIFTTKYPEALIDKITDNVSKLAELKDGEGNPLTVIDSPDDLLKLVEREMNLPVRSRTLLPTWGQGDSSVSGEAMDNLKNGQVTELLEYYNAELASLIKGRRKVKALLVYDTDQSHAIIDSVISKIDQKRRQVLVSMKVMEINTQVRDSLGLEWTFDGSTSTLDVKKLGDLSGIDINSTFNFLATKNLAKEVASPTIRVLDGHQASTEVITTKYVQVLERVNVVAETNSDSTDTTTGTNRVSGEEFRNVPQEKDFGLKMSVAPTVHQDQDVTINVRISQTVDAGDSTLSYNSGSGVISVPFTNVKTRHTSTIVRLKDGETAIMGGLIQNLNNNTDTQVPLVNRLPLLGRLFKNKTDEVNSSEMIILLTPHIVNEGTGKSATTPEMKRQSELDYAATIARLKSRLAE